MHELDELKAFIAKPETDTVKLRELLRNAEEQLALYEEARKVIHESGIEGWSYDVFQESLRVGGDSELGSVTHSEWDAMRSDARQRLHDRTLRTLTKGRRTFEELRGLLEQEIARRESPQARPAPEGKRSRWPFRRS